ncbi:hypothetical protein DSCA_64450 [Desulfosarcina alkanivorans]|jgi:hypothetical protein|uniref:Uncharacterized protein n=1 Tax=Desulfosarcina alkanivorans TaxID=571177 RepID=A0A5K7YVS6_9BACT|nr:hypothetical protein [Desulfosarcina alkanivorans]BBO72515.1 hypothetical protein DSCA_64450 [Desulfosarcina alkanivorans]
MEFKTVFRDVKPAGDQEARGLAKKVKDALGKNKTAPVRNAGLEGATRVPARMAVGSISRKNRQETSADSSAGWVWRPQSGGFLRVETRDERRQGEATFGEKAQFMIGKRASETGL